MPQDTDDHECDLFLFSSHHPYTANRSLLDFAQGGYRNIHGWGIGSYDLQTARVRRSASPALGLDGRHLSQEFGTAVEAISSPVILGHLRRASFARTLRRENNHPFELQFLGYQWLMIHNGTASNAERLVPPERRILVDSDIDTPRVFEFLRERILDYCQRSPNKSLIGACRKAFSDLLAADPHGTFNLVLSNGYLSFVLAHHRDFYLARRGKGTGDTALISTLKLNDDDHWIVFPYRPDRPARMLVFSGPTLIQNSEIPRRRAGSPA